MQHNRVGYFLCKSFVYTENFQKIAKNSQHISAETYSLKKQREKPGNKSVT